MMTASPDDVRCANDAVARSSQANSATFYGKHRIIASETSNIIFAKQMHHIAAGDASFSLNIYAFGVIWRETVELFTKLWYNEVKKGGEIIEKYLL